MQRRQRAGRPHRDLAGVLWPLEPLASAGKRKLLGTTQDAPLPNVLGVVTCARLGWTSPGMTTVSAVTDGVVERFQGVEDGLERPNDANDAVSVLANPQVGGDDERQGVVDG